MRTPYLAFAVAAAAALAWCVVGFADQPVGPQQTQSQETRSSDNHGFVAGPNTSKHLKASKLIGMDVWSDQNEKLGDIKDVIFDARSGRVEYAVLSFGGTLGIGDRFSAVPVKSLGLNWDPKKSEHYLTLRSTKDRLRQAPSFEGDRLPNFTDDEFLRQTKEFYGHAGHMASTQEREKGGFVLGQNVSDHLRCSKVIGMNVWNAQNEKLGEIKDMIVNAWSGDVDFAVLSHGGTAGIGDTLTPVPPGALGLEWDSKDSKHYLTLRMTKNQLANAPSFKGDAWPNFSDEQYVRRTYEFFGVPAARTAVRPGTSER
jgi:sporulation protein YlmC with PRC-barrel domain